MTIADRFWSKVLKLPEGLLGGHWLWTGSVNPNGYPQFSIAHRPVYAHRVSLALATGEPGFGLDAAHDDAKGCPRHCVRPDHLSWKTHEDNMKDVINKHGRICARRNVATRRLLIDEATA